MFVKCYPFYSPVGLKLSVCFWVLQVMSNAAPEAFLPLKLKLESTSWPQTLQVSDSLMTSSRRQLIKFDSVSKKEDTSKGSGG